MNCRNLRLIICENNPFELINFPIQLIRFFNRLRQTNIKKLSIRTDIPKYNKDELNDYIINDEILNCKEQLIEYINDESIHSLLLLTFSEVLWFVIQTIEHDFKDDEKREIKRILNEDMNDSLCKCFTGRMGAYY
jgi:hypothetical protein